MAINLVEAITEYLKGPLINQLAGVIGESPEKTRTATAGIVPALLSGLAGTASKPEGGNVLGSLLDKVDDGLLDQLGGLLGGPKAGALSESGGGLLSSLFGEQPLAALVAGVARYAGIDGEAAKSLLGFLAPVVLGGLKRLMRSQGLNLGGLVDLLRNQKDNLVKALPAGLASALGSTGWLSSATSPTQAFASRVPEPAAGGTPYLKWGLLALGLLLLGILATRWFSSETVTEPPRTGEAPAPTNIADQLTQVLGTANSTLRSITNPETAQAALPTLRDVNLQLEELRVAVDKAPPATKDMVAGRVSHVLPTLQAAIDEVLAIPGVAAVARPTLEVLRRNLAALAPA